MAARQAAACGVVAGSMAVHGCTGSWLTAVRATAGLSTAAGSTAGGLTAAGHTSRFAAGGFSDLTASLGAGGLTAAGLTAGGPAAGGPAAGRLTARGAAGMGHGVRCGGLASEQRQISQNLNTSSLLDLLYSGSQI